MSKYVDGIHEERFDQFLSNLRSGEFQQTKRVLKRENTFCCLGVMTEGVKHDLNIGCDLDSYQIGIKYFSSLLPRKVARYLGIPSSHVEAVYPHLVDSDLDEVNIMLVGHDPEEWVDESTPDGFTWATTLNDTYNKTFAEIADRFEETFTRKD